MHAVDPSLWTGLATLMGVWAVTVMSPGPNFVATVHASVAGSRRDGLLVAAGISVGCVIWCVATLSGLGLLFRSAPWLYHTVRIAGAAYLIWLGVRMVLAARRPAAPGAIPAGPAATGLAAFRRGLLTDMLNPKGAAFFTSLFAVALPPAAPLWFQAAVVAVMTVTGGGWYAAVACLMGSRRIAGAWRRVERVLSALTGGVFVLLGLRLAVDR